MKKLLLLLIVFLGHYSIRQKNSFKFSFESPISFEYQIFDFNGQLVQKRQSSQQ
jgi:hypothetical protein